MWETFKSRYELFEVGQDGKSAAPSPWASYEGLNPCGAEVDNRVKTLASFVPYADFNQPGFTLGEPLKSACGAEPDLYALRDPDQSGRI